MKFDVFVNGKLVGSFGHQNTENLSVSVSGAPDGTRIFAGVVCREDDKQFHYSWRDIDLREDDQVLIVRNDSGATSDPAKKYEMGRAQRKSWDNYTCDFCQRSEPEVRLIPGDTNRPTICSECVGLCVEILKAE